MHGAYWPDRYARHNFRCLRKSCFGRVDEPAYKLLVAAYAHAVNNQIDGLLVTYGFTLQIILDTQNLSVQIYTHDALCQTGFKLLAPAALMLQAERGQNSKASTRRILLHGLQHILGRVALDLLPADGRKGMSAAGKSNRR